MYDPIVSAQVKAALQKIRSGLRRHIPVLAPKACAWMDRLSPTRRPVDFLMHPRMFPMLLLPWWLARALPGQPDGAFHSDLTYSTTAGYCYIRVLDNLMDRHATVESERFPRPPSSIPSFRRSIKDILNLGTYGTGIAGTLTVPSERPRADVIAVVIALLRHEAVGLNNGSTSRS